MISKYFNPYTDFGFKKLFGEEASKELLIDFLNQLLPPQHQIAELSFNNPENMSDTLDERKSIFDIYCQSPVGRNKPVRAVARIGVSGKHLPNCACLFAHSI